MKNEFFGSKLNTVLLFILIILMVFAIRIMLQNKELYFPILNQEQQTIDKNNTQISGNKEDLISFSVLPGSKVNGLLSYEGTIQGAYFFEANILINILDANKNVLKKGNTNATTDWMTAGPVGFKGSIDFSLLPKGEAYIEIKNDNPSDDRSKDKSIYIPVIIE